MRILSCIHSIINSYSIVFLEKYSRLCESVNPFGAQVFDLVITIYHLESTPSKNAEIAQIKDMYMYLLKKVFFKHLYTHISSYWTLNLNGDRSFGPRSLFVQLNNLDSRLTKDACSYSTECIIVVLEKMNFKHFSFFFFV